MEQDVTVPSGFTLRFQGMVYLQDATTPLPMYYLVMPNGSGLTPQPVQNTNSLSILEEQQRQHQQQQANTGSLGQAPQLFHSQMVTALTTTAHSGNTPFSNTPVIPVTPVTHATPASESSEIVPQIRVISSVNLGCELDLKTIALKGRNTEYNPRRLAAVIMRLREPLTTAKIYSSGKIVCKGAESEEQSKKAARRFARMVQKLGFPARFLDFKIQNVMGSCDVKFPIRLELLDIEHRKFVSYEPELFPGLYYKMDKPKVTLRIFPSGKLEIAGAKESAEIYEAFEKIHPILERFRKTS